MHREVESLEKNMAILDPPDADHLYSAKVCILLWYTAKISELKFIHTESVCGVNLQKVIIRLKTVIPMFSSCLPDFVLVV